MVTAADQDGNPVAEASIFPTDPDLRVELTGLSSATLYDISVVLVGSDVQTSTQHLTSTFKIVFIMPKYRPYYKYPLCKH